MIRKLEEINLTDKTIFVRVDFNVPIHEGRITEPHRIDSALPTLRFILSKAKKVLIASHLGRPKGKRNPALSLAPVRDHLEKSLQCPVVLAPDCIGPEVNSLVQRPSPQVILLENLRFHEEEEKNDPAFSQALASLAEVYVNDAFGAAHRAHASVEGMVKHFREKGSGLLLQKELDYLGRALSQPEKPFLTILGGAKVSDKIAVIRNLLPKVDTFLIGGGMAYSFLKAHGIAVGQSLVEEDRIPLARELLTQSNQQGIPFHLPIDHVAADPDKNNPMTTAQDIPPDKAGFDIGPKTVADFAAEIRKAKMILWNGPLGLFEVEPFDRGTRLIAQAIAEAGAISILAGGDTVAAVTQAGLENKITHLSTGGGATLEFLEGRELPGVKALEE